MDKKDYSWIWIVVILVFTFSGWYLLWILPNTQSKSTPISDGSNYITIKYRDGQVDISNSRWDKMDKSDSDVRNAWYDDDNQYMVINLNGTYYHYCGMPKNVWESFSNTYSTSLDNYYTNNIKGEYDCRINPIPEY